MAVIRPSKLKKRSVEESELPEGFETWDDVADKINELATEADKTRKKAEKNKLLTEAQRLADLYQAHCEAGGNHVKQFKQFV